jgi:hypothetical protein
MDEYNLDDKNWRENVGDELVMLTNGMVVQEQEVYFALEQCLPFIQKKFHRYPTEEDIETFILALRGP